MASRDCWTCGENLPVESYPKAANARDGHSRHCKECTRIKRRKYPHSTPQSKAWRSREPERVLYSLAKQRAAKRGLAFTIEPSDIVIPERCPILGIPLVKGVGRAHHGSPSLDRIDNTRGYEKGNVMVISHRANHLKSDATAEELALLVKFFLMTAVDKFGSANLLSLGYNVCSS